MRKERALQILEDIATFSKEAGKEDWSKEIEEAEEYIESHLVDDETLDAIRKIVVYLSPDEGKDYEASGKPEDHIFLAVLKIAKLYDQARPVKQ